MTGCAVTLTGLGGPMWVRHCGPRCGDDRKTRRMGLAFTAQEISISENMRSEMLIAQEVMLHRGRKKPQEGG